MKSNQFNQYADDMRIALHHLLKILPLLCFLLALLTSPFASGQDKPSALTSTKKPSILLVLIDDMGWGNFGCFGNPDARTPNIDRLAAGGLRFEQFCVNSPICSPSRTALCTGQYPQRWRITSFLENRASNEKRGMAQWLNPKAPMLARSLHNPAAGGTPYAIGRSLRQTALQRAA